MQMWTRGTARRANIANMLALHNLIAFADH